MRNLKRILALVVVFAMTASFALMANAAAVFPDVDSADDNASAISLLKSLQIIGGDENGNYNPEKTITRAEFSKILFGLMNGSSDASLFTGASNFSDVSASAWYNGYVNWASNLNIVGGKGNGKFAPNDKVTVQEATKMFIVALTGKSNLAWPYGFVSEAKKANINLYDGLTITNSTSPALRNLIAQLCKNAIFATDVATFYTYNGDGSIATRNNAATVVFGLKALKTTVYETSFDNWQIAGSTAATGISAIDQMTVVNEDGTLVKVSYSSDMIGNNAGYTGTVYYMDNANGTANKLDSKDTIENVVLDDTTVAVAQPLNILSLSSTYQLQGTTFAPATDLSSTGKFLVMDANGVLITNESLATAITNGDMTKYLGTLTSSTTPTYGPNQDYEVKVVKNITTGLVGAIYVTKRTPFVLLTTYNQDAGIIAVNSTSAFKMTNPNSTSAVIDTPSLSLAAGTGTAPNKTTVVVNGAVAVGDYVAIEPTRDFNGVTYTVSPLLVNSGSTFTGIKSDGTVMFGDITYNKNALVAAAVTAGTLPDSASIFAAANLGKKMNVYLDATSRNYLYAELADSTTTASNYVFVKDIKTSIDMGVASYTVTVTDVSGTTKTYTLADGAISAAYLDSANLNAGSYGWKLIDNTSLAKTNTVIYHKVVKLTLNTDGNVSAMDPISSSVISSLKYDTTFKTLAENGTIKATIDASTIGFYYDNAASQLYIYTGNTLPGFDNAKAYYNTDNLKVQVLQFTDMGTALASSAQVGIVNDYYTVAGSTSGKVRYNVTATVGGALTADFLTSEEAVGGPIGTLLAASNKGAKFVQFTFSADGDTCVAMSNPTIASGSAMTDGAGVKVGLVTMTSNGLYAITGVEFPSNGYATSIGAPKYFTLDSEANIYTVPNTATNFADKKTALTPMLNKTSIALSSGVAGNLIASTDEVRYVIIFNSNDNNVITDAFIYQAVQVKTALTAVAGLVATPGATQVALAWTAQANASSYTVSYKLTADSTWTTSNVAVNSATITGLTTGSSYDFKVMASNANAQVDGAYSAVVSAIVA